MYYWNYDEYGVVWIFDAQNGLPIIPVESVQDAKIILSHLNRVN